MGISRKQLHVPVLPLHVPEGPFLGGRHPDGLRGLSRGRGLRGRLGRWSLRRLRGLGRRCWDGLFGRHRLRSLGAVFGAGGSTSSLGGGGCGCWGLGRRRGLSQRLRGHGGRSRLRLRLSQGISPRLCSLRSHGGLRILSHLCYYRKSVFNIEEHAERNTGAARIYHVAIHVGELKVKGAQGDGAVQFEEMPLVRSRLHDMSHAFVNNHFAQDIGAELSLDVGRGGQRAAAQV